MALAAMIKVQQRPGDMAEDFLASAERRYYGKRGQAFSSLNQLCKGRIRRSADGRKTVSNATIAYRRENYTRLINQLYELGYELRNIHNLKPKHVEALMQHWEAKGLSASTLQNRFSTIKLLCRWMGKASMLRDPVTYLADPQNYARDYGADHDHSWTAQGIDIAAKIAEIAEQDAHVARVLRLQQAFGLRIQEASLLNPGRDRQGTILRVVAGTKGGRPRTVPIATADQEAVLTEAADFAAQTGRSMIPTQYDLKQWLNHCYYVLRQQGITRKEGLVTHGLRHQYSNDQYEQITGEPSPVRGGQVHATAPEQDRTARLMVSGHLGHARESITHAYYGKADTVTTNSDEPKRQRKQFAAELRVQQQLLAARIKPYIGQRLNGKGKVGASTIVQRFRLLNRMLKILALNEQPLITPEHLSKPHINTLLHHWRSHNSLTAASANQNVYLLIQCCDWLDQPDLAHYTKTTWHQAQRGDTDALPLPLSDDEIQARLRRIRDHDPHIALHLELVRLIGLTHHQAAMLQPHMSYTEPHLDVIWEVPRNQALRFTLTTAGQQSLLSEACARVESENGTICPSDIALSTWMKKVYQVMRSIGRIGIAGEPSLAELKDPKAPTPIPLRRETWLAQKMGLNQHPQKKHSFQSLIADKVS